MCSDYKSERTGHELSVKFYSDRLCISPKAFYNEHIPLP